MKNFELNHIILNTVVFAFLLSSCNDNKKSVSENDKSIELKQKELVLKESELALREKDLGNRNNVAAENLNSGFKGSFPEVSLVGLTDEDLQNLDALDIRMMRNEISARYGYVFKLPELREYFDRKEWYSPIYDYVTIC